jgi:tripartite-type tricarboxylate transporter receptor subunit TctC
MKKLSIKTNSYVLSLAAFAAALPALAQTQTYPNRPLRMIVGFPPGGPTDLVARLAAQHLSEKLGQQVVTDNRPGAGGSVAGALMAKAAPDGHTLFTASNGEIAISPNLYKKMAYDPAKDLAPVSRIGSSQLVLMVHPAVQAQSVKELVALAKAKPGTINFASSGIGSTAQLCAELFKTLAAIDIVHVPYKGAGPAMTDLMGGQVQMLITGFSAALVHIKSGKLRALGVTGAKRLKAMPDLPTIGETVPGYEMTSWYGLFAPDGTPAPIVNRLQSEMVAMVKRQDMSDRFISLGLDAEASTPQEFSAQIKEEITKWAKVIKLARVPQQ